MPAKFGPRDELGLALTILRRLKGWTQEQLVAASGVSLSGLSALEQGQRKRPTLRTLGSVAAALGVDLAAVAEVAGLIYGLRWAAAPSTTADSASSRELADHPPIASTAPAFRRSVSAALLAAAGLDAPSAVLSGRRQALEAGSGKELGLALTLLRWCAGREQEELAVAAGIGQEALQAIEQGRRRRPPPELAVVLSALGVDLAALAKAVALVRKLRRLVGTPSVLVEQPVTAQPQQQAALRDQLAGVLLAEATTGAGRGASSQGEARRIEELIRLELGELAVVLRLLISRDEAPASWAALSACPEANHVGLVRQLAEFQTLGFCELLCGESLAAAGDSARRTRHLAELAVEAAEHAGGSEGLRSRLWGFAGFHLANALRVAGRDLPAAGETLERALAAWDAGAGADSGLLNAARVCGLTASLRRAQRRLPEALAALDEGLRIDRWGETPTLLLAKARALVELGEFEASIEQLRQAAAWIDGEREPRKLYVIEGLLVSNLCRLGQYAAAEQRLPGLRQLALPNRLDLLRVDWQTGTVAAGLGRADEAIAILRQVRADFIDTKNNYVAALVTLEIAEVHAALGHTAEVKALARESAPVFESQQVHREARRALALFRQAAEEERISGELLRRLIVYLHRARHDPQLRFEAVA
jgi:transcriptional regulator with XRE-family HTH domain